MWQVSLTPESKSGQILLVGSDPFHTRHARRTQIFATVVRLPGGSDHLILDGDRRRPKRSGGNANANAKSNGYTFTEPGAGIEYLNAAAGWNRRRCDDWRIYHHGDGAKEGRDTWDRTIARQFWPE